jgi:hypothetical protein
MNSPDNLQDKELDAAMKYAVIMRGLAVTGGNQAEHREAVETEALTEEGRNLLIGNYREYQRNSNRSAEILKSADRNENGPSR